MLKVENIHAGYGRKPILFGVSLEVNPGEIVAIVGPNGSGKSTLLKAICGVVPVWQGQVSLAGHRIDGSHVAKNARRGISFCLQGSRVFDELTVRENLEAGGLYLQKGVLAGRMNRVLGLLPVLRERLGQNAGTLSGGEQQVLALGRALISEPKLLLLDEPSLGLSPNMIASTFGMVQRTCQDAGIAVLVVEQKVREVLRISNRVYGLRLGRIAFDGSPSNLSSGDRLRELFL